MLVTTMFLAGLMGLQPVFCPPEDGSDPCSSGVASVSACAVPTIYSIDETGALIKADDEAPRVFRVAIASDDVGAVPANAYSFAFSTDDAGLEPAAYSFAFAADDAGLPQVGGPWLGVQYSPVPDALIEHMSLDGGAMLLQVIDGSPAAEAGLARNDIITEFNGRLIGNDVGALREAIGEVNVGDRVKVRYLHAGRSMAATLTITGRPEHMALPAAPFDKNATTEFRAVMPHLYMLDENGNLVKPQGQAFDKMLESLPQLGNFEDLDLKTLGNGAFSGTIARTTDDGGRINITRHSDGRITVKRTDADGTVSENSYDNAEALKNADIDAHELYQDSFSFSPGGVFKARAFGNMQDVRRSIEEALRDIQPQLDAMPQVDADMRMQVEAAMRQMREQMNNGGTGSAVIRSGQVSRTRSLSIQRGSDGTITVTTRDEDGELTETFKDEAELKQLRPEIYSRFMNLRTPVAVDVLPQE